MSRRRRGAARPAILIGAVCLALVLFPAGAIEPGSEIFNVTVTVIQTTPDVLAEAEAKLGFALDAASGRCILTADEHAALAKTVVGEGRGHVLAKGVVLIAAGSKHTYEDVERVRVPKRYGVRHDPSDASRAPRLVATQFVERDIGFAFEPHCLGRLARGVLPMAIQVHLDRVSGYNAIATNINEPVIKSWGLSTAFNAPLNKTVVLVNAPHEPFESSAMFRTGKAAPATVMLLLIRVE